VTLGQRELGAVEVTTGLAPGEAVVVRGSPRLRDGAAVRVLEPESAPAQQGSTGTTRAGPA